MMRGGVRARATILISALLVALGVVLIVETALVGGGVGFFVGVLFLGAGVLRIVLARLA
jgi:hypothetical protein